MLKLIVAIITTILGLMATSAPISIDAQHYANQTPYGNAAPQVKAPPEGYHQIFLETVARHGSRTLTSSAPERRSLQVWEAASKQDALTDIGKSFADDVEAFKKPEQAIGYGNLSTIGKLEWSGIGRRTAANYQDFLTTTIADGDRIVFNTTPFTRTEESADAMRESMTTAIPKLDIAPYVTDAARLVLGNGASFAGNKAVDRIEASPEAVAAAKGLLGRLYTSAYVDSLDEPVDAALDIYLLYCTAAGMRADSNVTFERYVPLEYAKVLEYLKDAENFYRFGPGVAGESNSYEAARPLLEDFFAQLDKRIDGGSTAAVFRLAHGETTMPFAALIKAPGSQKQAPKGGVYTYADNPWRGYVAGRPGGNIEWAAYRNASGQVLVTMRYNEHPVKFHRGCTASTADPYFYAVSQLKKCLG